MPNGLHTRLVTTVLLVLTWAAVRAQTFTLSGRVVDEERNPIELANVTCSKQAKHAITNLKGEFSIVLKSEDSVEVKFSMVGFNARKRLFRKPQGKMVIEVMLPSLEALGEVVVTERRRQNTPTEQLDTKETKRTPSASGNAVEELVQQQAGVSSHNELSSQYNVRGGSFDENSVYINNIEVYRPLLVRSGEQEGLSVINADMVESIGFSSGGYEARYGDKMSSALDIRYRRPEKFEANVQASLLGASAYLGTGSSRFSMSHGVRYKTNRYLLGTTDTKGEYRPSFLDYQTYLTYKPSKRWLFEFIGNISENHYNFSPEDRETNFGTLQNAKTFKVYFDGQEKDIFRTLFGNLSITYNLTPNTHISLLGSAFHTKEREAYDIQGQYWLDDSQSAEQLGVGTYMEHARNRLTANVMSTKLMVQHRTSHHQWEGAVTLKHERIEEYSREWEMRDSSGYTLPHSADRLDMIYSLTANNKLSSNRVEAYLQDTYRWATGGTGEGEKQSYFTLSYGVRMSHWSFNKETTVSPRIALAVTPAFNQDLTLRLATGIYYQAPFFKEMRDTTMLNGQTMVTFNENIKSPRSIHVVAAMDYRFKMLERSFRFTAEAYYKALDRLIPYNVQNMKLTYYGENLGKGHAAGLDLKLFGEFVPGADSWLTLSLMSTKQEFNGHSIPLPTDQRWAMNLHFTDYFPGTERWRMTLRLAFADGLPFGAPHRGLEYQQFRAPAYKRADIGMSYLAYDYLKGSSARTFVKRVWVGLDCLNLFGINNVNSYYWVTDVSNQQYAVPNFLTGRLINAKVGVEF
ncbi:MAG: carboxypeptidase-like regulatory domain-containing protein [Prevotella sp.]|nr:carboxypeptidase-like regulatory domain-containing protein [Prevotella sp.]